MTNSQLSINIFLYEEFLKEPYYWERKIVKNSLDLFTPEGFFLLWNKAQEQEWWAEFVNRQHNAVAHSMRREHLWLSPFINPLTFPTLLAEYLGWKE